jgi:Transketolase
MQQAKLKGMTSQELDQLAINTIRTLSIDAVQQANQAIRARRWRSHRSST